MEEKRVPDPVVSGAKRALSVAVARFVGATQAFARSQRWQSLVDALATLAEAFDFHGVLAPGPGAVDAPVAELDASRLGERIAEIFEDVLLTDGLLEGSGDARTFLIGARSVRDLPGAANLADAFEDLQLRVRVTAVDGEVDLALSVATERVQIAVLHLDANGGWLESDLARLKRAMELLGLVLVRRFRDAHAPPFDLPDAHGRVRVSFTFAKEHAVGFAIDILRPLGLVFRAGGRPYGLSVQPSAGALTVSADVAVGVLDLRVRLGRTSFAFASLEAGVAELIVAGLSCRLGFAENQKSLLLNDFGMGSGAATVQVDEKRLVTWDVNEGSTLAVELEPRLEERAVLVTVSPGCKLRIACNLTAVQDELALPATLVDDSYEIRLAGAPARVLLVPGGAVIDAGTLTVQSKNAGCVTAVAGQTVRLRDRDPGGAEHPLLARLAVGDQ